MWRDQPKKNNSRVLLGQRLFPKLDASFPKRTLQALCQNRSWFTCLHGGSISWKMLFTWVVTLVVRVLNVLALRLSE